MHKTSSLTDVKQEPRYDLTDSVKKNGDKNPVRKYKNA